MKTIKGFKHRNRIAVKGYLTEAGLNAMQTVLDEVGCGMSELISLGLTAMTTKALALKGLNSLEGQGKTLDIEQLRGLVKEESRLTTEYCRTSYNNKFSLTPGDEGYLAEDHLGLVEVVEDVK